MLVSFALPNPSFSRHLTQNPQRDSVEYRLHWVPNTFLRWACTFHILCIDFICVWWPTQIQYPVEYGLKTYIKILRHPSLQMDPKNMYSNFQACKSYNKQDIHVQKIHMENKYFYFPQHNSTSTNQFISSLDISMDRVHNWLPNVIQYIIFPLILPHVY